MRDLLKLSGLKSLALFMTVVLAFTSIAAGIGAGTAVTDSASNTLYSSPDGTGTNCTLIDPCSLMGARDKVLTIGNTPHVKGIAFSY